MAGKTRHSQRMRNPQFNVSGKRPIGLIRLPKVLLTYIWVLSVSKESLKIQSWQILFPDGNPIHFTLTVPDASKAESINSKMPIGQPVAGNVAKAIFVIQGNSYALSPFFTMGFLYWVDGIVMSSFSFFWWLLRQWLVRDLSRSLQT